MKEATFSQKKQEIQKRKSKLMMFIFFITALFICILVAFGVMMSVALQTRHTFKHGTRPWKRPLMRGAIIASPLLDDALFSKKEEHSSFWSGEVEYDEAYYM